jgi:pSer/pThr/pTyr-binding forkhead associated (FHA) protein
LPDEPLKVIAASGGAVGWLHWDGGDYEIAAQEIQIGRDPQEAEVILDEPQASWLHAEITRHMGRFYVRDLGSASGTFVNGTLVTTPRLLRDADLITVGSSHITFRTAERGAEQPSPRPRRDPPPPPPPSLEVRSGAR